MIKMKKKSSLILIIFLLFFQVEVQAIGIGTLVKNTRSEVMRGETTKFTILLWNSENSSYPVKFRATEVPEGISVIIDPKELIMNSSTADSYSTESGMEYINTQYGLMKLTPVDVLVKVSKSINLGEFDVYVNLDAGESKTWISTIYEKTFKFNVKVVNYINTTKKTTNEIQKIDETSNNIMEKITGMSSKISINSSVIFIFSLMIGIFLVAWVIYKHG
jgi:ribosomal protein L23